jgi:hypothetical protein
VVASLIAKDLTAQSSFISKQARAANIVDKRSSVSASVAILVESSHHHRSPFSAWIEPGFQSETGATAALELDLRGDIPLLVLDLESLGVRPFL